MFQRILAQIRKEITQVRRDKLTLALALGLPLALLLLMSTAISLTPTDIPVVVRDYDQSPASRALISAYRSSLTFYIIGAPLDWTPERIFETKTARAVIVIPETFSRRLHSGRSAEVQTIVDATDTNTANQIRGYVSLVTGSFGRQLSGGAPAPIQLETRLWFNPGRKSTRFYGPGMLAFVLSIFPPLLSSLAMAREGEQKTILQVYVSSIGAFEYLVGKTLAFMIVAAAEWALAVLAVMVVFGLRFAGDPIVFLVGTLLFLFTSVSFGVLVGSAIPSQALAIQAVSMGGFLSAFLLSGLIFPVENIPVGLRWISNIVHSRYYIDLTRDAFLQGGGWAASWFRLVMITAIGLFFFLMAWRGMRKMQVKA